MICDAFGVAREIIMNLNTPAFMQGIGGLFVLLYICCVIGVTIFALSLFWRFVRAQERTADSLDTIARKFRDDSERR
jgi:hypothetical protein